MSPKGICLKIVLYDSQHSQYIQKVETEVSKCSYALRCCLKEFKRYTNNNSFIKEALCMNTFIKPSNRQNLLLSK